MDIWVNTKMKECYVYEMKCSNATKPQVNATIKANLWTRWGISQCREQQHRLLNTRYLREGTEDGEHRGQTSKLNEFWYHLVKSWELFFRARCRALSDYASCKISEGFSQNGCEGDSFIYVYLQDAVLYFLSRDSSLSWYFFCFY
jgi:hypothetical protein